MCSPSPKKILLVGLSCIDIISSCDHYPEEDTDQRCEQKWQMGGNASNSSRVLGLLGAEVECMCTMADTYELGFLKEEFCRHHVNIDNVVLHSNCKTPISVVIVNTSNGSRTILHSNKNLPEVTAGDFNNLNLEDYDWIHFEGRPNVGDIVEMLQMIDTYNEQLPDTGHRITTSVELEKTRNNLLELTNKADYIFISKEHSQMRGFQTKEKAVEAIVKECRKGSSVICPWGEDGAIARSTQGDIVTSYIYAPLKVKDTLGAGDTFNAGTIYALRIGKTLKEAIRFGSWVAGAKCGIDGFDNLAILEHDFINKPCLPYL